MSVKKEKTRQEVNEVRIIGIIKDEFKFSHEFKGKKFYQNIVIAKRLSGTEDYVPIMVPEGLIFQRLNETVKGNQVEIFGQFRSYNKIGNDGQNHLQLHVFVNAIKFYQGNEESEEKTNINSIYLDGYICTKPVFRFTPAGRKITELIIAVNRDYNKSSYIPCIAWEKNSKCLSTLKVGDRIQLNGRIQSRAYFKRKSPDSQEGEYRVAYEISIANFNEVKDEISEE